MTVVFFSKGDYDVVSSRYRCFHFAEALEATGVSTRICDPPPALFDRQRPLASLRELLRLGRELLRVRGEDIAYFQRPVHNTLFVGMIAAWKKLFRRRMVFDFCDPIFVQSPRKMKLLARLADVVIVSCEDLAVWARRYNERVEIVPNSIREGTPYRTDADAADGERTVIGWAGAARLHEENLRILFPALARLSGSFTFRLMGARGADHLVAELEALGVPVEPIEWVEPEHAAGEIARFEIAVLPARDILWNRKLMTKLIDYMAAGLAVVASPVGENRFAITDGENGFLAASEDEWVAKLERLVADAELRRRFGSAARRTVAERYSLPVSGRRLAEILRRLAAGD